MTLSSIDLCIQLGRFIGRATGDLFVEPTASSKGTIYSAPLPALKHRLDPAVAIVPQPSSTDEPMAVTSRTQLVMHATGKSDQIALGKLNEYAAIIWPDNRPNLLVENPHAPGIMGVPTATGTYAVWRTLGVRQLDHPSIKPRTEEGLAAASFALEIHAIETSVVVV